MHVPFLVAFWMLVGCEHNCQETCDRIYSESECAVTISGVTVGELQQNCVSECTQALQEAGAMGDYNPYNQRDPTENFELQNERQAAEWMDCVWSVECEDLQPENGGVCWPI